MVSGSGTIHRFGWTERAAHWWLAGTTGAMVADGRLPLLPRAGAVPRPADGQDAAPVGGDRAAGGLAGADHPRRPPRARPHAQAGRPLRRRRRPLAEGRAAPAVQPRGRAPAGPLQRRAEAQPRRHAGAAGRARRLRRAAVAGRARHDVPVRRQRPRARPRHARDHVPDLRPPVPGAAAPGHQRGHVRHHQRVGRPRVGAAAPPQVGARPRRRQARPKRRRTPPCRRPSASS